MHILFRLQLREQDHVTDAFLTEDRQAFNQSSTRSPLTRLNSLVLLLTSVNPCARQIAAILRSFGPMTSERVSKS